MIAIGDLHGRIDVAKKVLNIFKKEKKLFIGDYVDSFIRPDIDNIDTLKAVLDSDAILLVGNHEYNYYGPFAQRYTGDLTHYYCSGFRFSLFHHIFDILEQNEDRFKLAHYENDALFTHAGVTKGWVKLLQSYNDILDIQSIIKKLLKIQPFKLKDTDPVFEVVYRAGLEMTEPAAGPLWCDFKREFQLVEGLNQVFGHTAVSHIIKFDGNNSKNFCIDCVEKGVNQVLEVTEKSKFKILTF